jgi:hypothetical protein
MDGIARAVLLLLMRDVGLRSDTLHGILDDVNLPPTSPSSCILDVVRYRGTGEDGRSALPRITVLEHRMACAKSRTMGRDPFCLKDTPLSPDHLDSRRVFARTKWRVVLACLLSTAVCVDRIQSTFQTPQLTQRPVVLPAPGCAAVDESSDGSSTVRCSGRRSRRNKRSRAAPPACGAQTHVDQSVLTVVAADTIDGLQVQIIGRQQAAACRLPCMSSPEHPLA